MIPLHSVLTSQDQSEAFDVPPPGCRKIVIATNIAETGITIPDVVFVIDTGKAKENRFASPLPCETVRVNIKRVKERTVNFDIFHSDMLRQLK